jgi:hypothetical protein
VCRGKILRWWFQRENWQQHINAVTVLKVLIQILLSKITYTYHFHMPKYFILSSALHSCYIQNDNLWIQKVCTVLREHVPRIIIKAGEIPFCIWTLWQSTYFNFRFTSSYLIADSLHLKSTSMIYPNIQTVEQF